MTNEENMSSAILHRLHINLQNFQFHSQKMLQAMKFRTTLGSVSQILYEGILRVLFSQFQLIRIFKGMVSDSNNFL